MAFTCTACAKEFRTKKALAMHYADEPDHRAGEPSYGDLKARCRGASLGAVLRVARDMLDVEIQARREVLKNAKVVEAQVAQLERHRSQVAELVLRYSDEKPQPAG